MQVRSPFKVTDNKEQKYTLGYILNNVEVKNRAINRKKKAGT